MHKNSKIGIKCRQVTALQPACDNFNVFHTLLATGDAVVVPSVGVDGAASI